MGTVVQVPIYQKYINHKTSVIRCSSSRKWYNLGLTNESKVRIRVNALNYERYFHMVLKLYKKVLLEFLTGSLRTSLIFNGSEPLSTTQPSYYQLSSDRGLRTGNSIAELQSITWSQRSARAMRYGKAVGKGDHCTRDVVFCVQGRVSTVAFPPAHPLPPSSVWVERVFNELFGD
ncbi:hypothetical protein J6590_053756 [Homalodisca vitripennis]|nr:hypothetical protein J6590_053756 [Homalodisca vitripennis]